jgi:hypothetical protein
MIMPATPPDPYLPFQHFVAALLAADWDDPAGPLRLSDNLALPELARAPFFLNARCLLRVLDAAGGTAATAAGNLNRVFARRMFDQLDIPTPIRDSVRRICKVINEHDVPGLHFARVVCECGKLIAHRNKRFTVTRRGQELLPDDQAGTLYRQLFLAHFRQFNLGYRFPLRDVPGIQQTMTVILWRLSHVARDWTPVDGLAEGVLIPPVYDQLRAAHVSQYDTDAWILAGYVLNPLLEFGLLEKQSARDWPGISKEDHIRVTGLFQSFISFPGEP